MFILKILYQQSFIFFLKNVTQTSLRKNFLNSKSKALINFFKGIKNVENPREKMYFQSEIAVL